MDSIEKAINLSIKKYEKYVETLKENLGEDKTLEELGINLSISNCALCNIFNTPNYRCFGCPIMEKTGKKSCVGTPYGYIEDFIPVYNCETIKITKGFIKLFEDEVEFLKSLK